VKRIWQGVLVHDIYSRMPDVTVSVERGRVWVKGDVKPECLRRIFGIVSFSEVTECTLDTLAEVLPNYLEEHGIKDAKSFAFRVKRVGNHPFNSREKEIELANLVLEPYPNLKIDLDHAELEVSIEIRQDRCYLFTTVEEGPGGLPAGVEGTLVALVSGGIDSPVASYMMMKRGCRIIPIYVALDSFLTEKHIARAEQVIECLRQYQPDIELHVISDDYLIRAKQALVARKLEKYTCVFCKRRMYRLATKFAEEVGALGIVTGESLGQVASQTLDNMTVLTNATTMPIHRPLIGLDKTEIISIARKIGTFEDSIAKAGGCGAVPKMPCTKAKLELVQEIEEEIGI
jgi:thiamine biosynthesis protein ThiI